jgi:hypothetical protein
MLLMALQNELQTNDAALNDPNSKDGHVNIWFLLHIH